MNLAEVIDPFSKNSYTYLFRKFLRENVVTNFLVLFLENEKLKKKSKLYIFLKLQSLGRRYRMQ